METNPQFAQPRQACMQASRGSAQVFSGIRQAPLWSLSQSRFSLGMPHRPRRTRVDCRRERDMYRRSGSNSQFVPRRLDSLARARTQSRALGRPGLAQLPLRVGLRQ
eukprot:4605350-Prymnesium_polylepis.1